ncbi:acyltransferase [Roseivivax sp. THAF197b]|uniref:acyltransferase family protein n=1 Tax=Roseivivax sp. THAF197b TaxID=2588299 RepID=UPI001267DF0C|nr:acyltransferase [Roseivivax sp. THAF197b]QFS84820.1 O-acetyltransferase OatA [Roseivivax sp. THAF197b]
MNEYTTFSATGCKNMTTSSNTGRHYSSLDSLRGFAAISVALFHFNIDSHINNTFIKNSWLMIDFFFILSGFVIALAYLERIHTAKDLYNFQKRRFLRLYPLHIVMLFVFLGIEIIKYLAQIYLNLDANNRAFSANNTSSFIANLLLIHDWILSEVTWNYPSWSISSEFYTYLIFGASVLFFSNGRRDTNLILLFILYASITGYILYSPNLEPAVLSGPIRCIYSFSIGVLVYYLFKVLHNRVRLGSSIYSGSLLFMCGALIYSNNKASFNTEAILPLIFGASILTLVLTDKSTLINKLLENRILVYLGTISYGIYMIHAAIWWFAIQFLRVIFKFPTKEDSAGNVNIEIENYLLADLITVFGIIIIILFSHISYQKIEKRFYR